MMKIAYLIHAHKHPAQVARLVRSLAGGSTGFFIHIDKNVRISPFRRALDEVRESDVSFVRREDGSWGRFGIVRAALNGIQQILSARTRFDRITLLSGSDYPLANNHSIYNFFREHSSSTFMEFFPLPTAQWTEGGMDRIERYHFRLFVNRIFPPYESPSRTVAKLFYAALRLYFPLPRSFPTGLRPYGGSHWWSMNRDTARYVLDFCALRPDYIHFHHYTRSADEIFMQTILLNSTDERVYINMIHDDLHYTDWTKPNVPLPAVLRKEDFSAMIRSGKLFARKFDIETDVAVLDLIDRHREQSEVSSVL